MIGLGGRDSRRREERVLIAISCACRANEGIGYDSNGPKYFVNNKLPLPRLLWWPLLPRVCSLACSHSAPERIWQRTNRALPNWRTFGTPLARSLARRSQLPSVVQTNAIARQSNSTRRPQEGCLLLRLLLMTTSTPARTAIKKSGKTAARPARRPPEPWQIGRSSMPPRSTESTRSI